jgi:hypothetical protein
MMVEEAHCDCTNAHRQIESHRTKRRLKEPRKATHTGRREGDRGDDQRDEALTNILHRLRVPQHAYKMGIDMISVEGHSCSSAAAVMYRYFSDFAASMICSGRARTR